MSRLRYVFPRFVEDERKELYLQAQEIILRAVPEV
jgi:hypothetical protein